MSTTRRDFLKTGMAAGAAAPLGAQLAPSWLRSAGGGADDPILVIVQAAGGYDMFNMLIPANDPVYVAARPNIGIPQAQTIGEVDSGSGLYWHPSLSAFKTLYDAGALAVIQNIGYPQPNLSHFESMKIWYAGDRVALGSGWLGRYLENAYAGASTIPAIDAESRKNPSFEPVRIPVLVSPESFAFQFDAQTAADNLLEELALRVNSMWLRPTPHPNLQFAADATVAAMDDSAVLQNVGQNYAPMVQYPDTTLTRALQLAARYITGGLDTHLYYAQTGGFDNHANLANPGAPATGTLANLLTGLSDSIKAFHDDMQAHGVTRPLLIMVWTEFSRRFGENSSYGTDHGHGGLAFLIGQRVNAGRYGTYPDLSQARQPYDRWFPPFDANSTDFRSLYATVLERWLGVDHTQVLGGPFPLLGAL